MKPTGLVKFFGFISAPPFLIRVPLYGLLWVVLTGGQLESWLLGAPTVLMAAWISAQARRFATGRFSIWNGIRFTGFFLKASLMSGLDVVRRALRPQMALCPDLIDYRLALSTEAARIFTADAVSLLPGTLSADLTGANLTIHVLDRNLPIKAELRALEERVAAMLESGSRQGTSTEGDFR
jgi:multicomponent Na+:H+ antiporter subunit E